MDTTQQTKRCSSCELPKALSRFGTFADQSGQLRPRGVCWDCRDQKAEEKAGQQTAYRRTYNAKKRSVKRERDRQRRLETRAVVDGLKAVPCRDCGNKFPAVAMDFDHLGSKIKSVAMMVAQAYKLELILEEIKKCEVVCACCHRIRTEKRKQHLAPSAPTPTLRDCSQDLVEDIFDLFGAQPAAVFSVADIAKRVEAKYGAVAKRLRALVGEQKLVSPRRGLYSVPGVSLVQVPSLDVAALQDQTLASLPLRARIIAWFLLHPTSSFSAAELRRRISFGAASNSINVKLLDLAREHRLTRLEHGQYRLPSETERRLAPEPRVETVTLLKERERFQQFKAGQTRSCEMAVV